MGERGDTGDGGGLPTGWVMCSGGGGDEEAGPYEIWSRPPIASRTRHRLLPGRSTGSTIEGGGRRPPVVHPTNRRQRETRSGG
jgi:hypothetical protein